MKQYRFTCARCNIIIEAHNFIEAEKVFNNNFPGVTYIVCSEIQKKAK